MLGKKIKFNEFYVSSGNPLNFMEYLKETVHLAKGFLNLKQKITIRTQVVFVALAIWFP